MSDTTRYVVMGGLAGLIICQVIYGFSAAANLILGAGLLGLLTGNRHTEYLDEKNKAHLKPSEDKEGK